MQKAQDDAVGVPAADDQDHSRMGLARRDKTRVEGDEILQIVGDEYPSLARGVA